MLSVLISHNLFQYYLLKSFLLAQYLPILVCNDSIQAGIPKLNVLSGKCTPRILFVLHIRILVNKENPLTEDVECELVKFDGFEIDIRIYEDVLQMFKDAKEEGCNLFLASGYRDYNTQRFLYEKKISYFKKLGYDSKEAEEIASMKVTPPLTSEHETGLAVDILSYAYNNMDAGFGQSEAGIWLSENCYKYGFILRYPEGKEDITEIQYEPWHFRYVGKEAAEFIYVNKLTFEEFYEMVQTNNE